MQITIEFAEQLVNYLAKRPYGEVFAMIHELQDNAKKVVTAPASEPKQDEKKD